PGPQHAEEHQGRSSGRSSGVMIKVGTLTPMLRGLRSSCDTVRPEGSPLAARKPIPALQDDTATVKTPQMRLKTSTAEGQYQTEEATPIRKAKSPSFSSHLPTAENQHQPPGTTANDITACKKFHISGSRAPQHTKSQPKFSDMSEAVKQVHWLENNGYYAQAELCKADINPIAFQDKWPPKFALKHAVKLIEQGNTNEGLKYLNYIIERDSSVVGQKNYPLGYYFAAVRKKAIILKTKYHDFEKSIQILEKLQTDVLTHKNKFPEKIFPPDVGTGLRLLWTTYLEAYRWDDADKIYDAVLASSLNSPEHAQRLRAQQCSTRNPSEPENTVEECVKLRNLITIDKEKNLSYVMSFYYEACSYWYDDQTDRVLSIIEKHIPVIKFSLVEQTTPDSKKETTFFWVLKAYCFWLVKIGKYTEAMNVLKEFKNIIDAIDKKLKHARGEKTVSTQKSLASPPSALLQSNKTVDSDPENPIVPVQNTYYCKAMVKIYFEQGNYSKARQAVEFAVAYFPDNHYFDYMWLRINAAEANSEGDKLTSKQLNELEKYHDLHQNNYGVALHYWQVYFTHFVYDLCENRSYTPELKDERDRLALACKELCQKFSNHYGVWSSRGHITSFDPLCNSDQVNAFHEKARQLHTIGKQKRQHTDDKASKIFKDRKEKALQFIVSSPLKFSISKR
ncbi:hypothetical protein, partial [Endozoicomonas sp.]|uniref:hypothetical protein n=1 Tax=Endozoicomonas sp. TaxID=1892382 RepID=UPI00383AB686